MPKTPEKPLIFAVQPSTLESVCFNPRHPMTPRWLPEAVSEDRRMVWLFGGPGGEGAAPDREAQGETE